ncbi:hypothetical protein LDENG_00193310 [Lucifuga dentata]|nr:hypothetical protein LDENG_00193310 [Lucifuga dentata]
MQTAGGLMELYLGRCVLSLVLLLHICLAAPGLTGAQREALGDVPPPSTALANPFGSTEQDRSIRWGRGRIISAVNKFALNAIIKQVNTSSIKMLLQSYIQYSLKDSQGEPEISTWEQEVFFLFRLYDYDRSGALDGLEMMKLLSDYNSHRAAGVQTNEQVVSMVDLLLQTQDLNQDGLLAPSELLSPPLPHAQDSTHNDTPHKEQEVTVEEKLSDPSTEEKAAAVKEEEEAHEEEIQPKQEETPEEEVKTEEAEQQNEQHIPEGEQGQEQQVPVHQGQPEI